MDPAAFRDTDFTTGTADLFCGLLSHLKTPEALDRFQGEVIRSLKGLPRNVRDCCEYYLHGVDQKDEKIVESQSHLLGQMDLIFLRAVPDQVAFGQVLFLALKKSYENTLFTLGNTMECLFPFLGYFADYGHLSDLQELYRYPFLVMEWFCLAYHDQPMRSAFVNDDLLRFIAGPMKHYCAGKAFRPWVREPANLAFLQEVMRHWVGHLANFLQIHRERAFSGFLDILVAFVQACPELAETVRPLVFLLPLARERFLPPFDKKLPHIAGILRPFSHDDAVPVLNDMSKAFASGPILNAPADGGPPVETEGLTVDYVFQAALDEILGDGNITGEEEAVLHSLRDYLEIPPDRFQQIFSATMARIQAMPTPPLARDFCPEPFLFRIFLKPIRRGGVTPEDKELVRKLCQALLIDRETVARAFEHARAVVVREREIPCGEPLPPEVTHFAPLFRLHQEERHVKTLLETAAGAAVRKMAATAFEAYKDAALRQVGQDGLDTLLDQWLVVNFLFDGGVCPLPVLCVFLNGRRVEPVRLQFKGRCFDVYFNGDIAAQARKGLIDCDGRSLTIQNQCLDRYLNPPVVFLGEELKTFLDGIEQSGGEYLLALVHLESLMPVRVIHQRGYLDATGKLALGLDQMGQEHYPEAIETFRLLHEARPGLQGALYNIGLAYRLMAKALNHSAELIGKAREAYLKELQNHPSSAKAVNSMAILAKVQEDYETALQCFETGLGLAPDMVPMTISHVSTLLNRGFQSDQPEAVSRIVYLLCLAYQTDPDSALVKQVLEQCVAIIGPGLLPALRQTAVFSHLQ